MKQLVAVGVVLVLLFGVACKTSNSSRAPGVQATIAKVEGAAEFFGAGPSPQGTTWQPARIGQLLNEGEQARTGADGRMDIQLSPHGGVMSLTPNTTITIEQLGPRGTNKQAVAVIRLSRGRVIGDTLKLPKDSKVMVKTAAGTFGIP